MIKSITLTGFEVRVDNLGGQNAAVKNLGAGTLYASIYPNIEPNADNVAEIPPNGGEVLLDANGTLYLLGTGKVQCTGTPYASPNFKQPSPSSGTSGGGGETTNTGNTGVYCGTAEFLDSSEGIKSIPIDSTNGLPRALAAALAAETGWELQSDGVTVLKDGGVGFSFYNGHVYISNNINHRPSGADFQIPLPTKPYLDILRSADKTAVAFGIRDEGESVNLTFILAADSSGNDVSMATYSNNLIYLVGRDEADYKRVSYIAPAKNAECISVTLLPDTITKTLFKNVFLMFMCDTGPQPGEQFIIGGKRFVTVYNRIYGTQPILALPV